MLSFFITIDMRLYQAGFLILLFSACSTVDNPTQLFSFESIDPDQSGIHFRNDLSPTEQVNTYTYRNFYNGAGVAIGDINNDGLPELFFCGNQVSNKLYLNKGNFKFEDITSEAGVASDGVWSTGASFVDINGDGLLDIYVCKSGPLGGANRHNELFINQGNLTFEEKAQEYGIDDTGLSNHAAFFDYDKDGDLDMYLLNNSMRSVGIYDLREGERNVRDTLGGNRFYLNENGKFKDISEEAGIYGSAIGFGLGVTIADINRDGWQDIFVSNDFFERDYLYINQKDGRFKESLEQYMTEISMGSMGADIADINNDGYPEIYVTEMLPESQERVKTKTVFEGWDKYQASLKKGFYRQFTRNALQLNNGPVDGKQVSFSEISRISGLHATDWSWGAILADFANDGNKDVFVANGIGKDLTDHDYVSFYYNNQALLRKFKKDSVLMTKLLSYMPSVPLSNYFFKNKGGLEFENIADQIGLGKPGFSNGAAYGDLDRDGDLDLVVNNIDDFPGVFRNNNNTANHYIQLKITGTKKNTSAIGTQVTVYCGENQYYYEHNPVKGYMSSMDHLLHIGIGKNEKIDSIRLIWPDLTITTIVSPVIDQLTEVFQEDAKSSFAASESVSHSLLTKLEVDSFYSHKENEFVDFDRDRLLFLMRSNEGPALAISDTDGEASKNVFFGGAKGQAGQLFSMKDGTFTSIEIPELQEHSGSEDTKACFFDANGDGLTDLYVTSGGNEFSVGSRELLDQLYINRGNNQWEDASKNLPQLRESSSSVASLDYDKDGDLDLVVAERLKPFAYGAPCSIHLFENDGMGNFADVTQAHAAAFKDIGMPRDVVTVDVDNDKDLDVVACGEWMPVSVFINENGQFINKTVDYGLSNSSGLWNAIATGDLNEDGFPDFIVGNHGLNSKLKADAGHPLELDINDYDGNGAIDHILTVYQGDKSYPLVQLSDLIKQLPFLKKKYIKHEDYKDKTLTDLFGTEILARSVHWAANELASVVLLSNGGKGYSIQMLPFEAQISPVFGIAILDIDGDEHLDLIVGGNQTRVKPELGINLASYGAVLLGNGKGEFRFVSPKKSGLFIKGEVRAIASVSDKDKEKLIFVLNNDEPVFYSVNDN